MEFLRIAVSSSNPAIVDVALSLAKERQQRFESSQKRLSPVLTVTLATGIVSTAGIACVLIIHDFPQQQAVEIVCVILCLVLASVALYALLSGHLSQANFMTILKWVRHHIKQLSPAEGTSVAIDSSVRDTRVIEAGADDDLGSHS